MNAFGIGDIVTLRSHPLFNGTPQKIKEFPAQVPPLMLIKEVIFEREDKKKIYSDVIEKAQIADLVKYVCVFFNANKSEFVEKEIYHSFLDSYLKLKYYRKEETENGKKIIQIKKLIEEVADYKKAEDYDFGKRIQFKTKKLEHRKSYSNSFERVPGTSFQTPDFILSGIKNEEQKDLFFQDSKPKRLMTKQSYKVMWFNHAQQKFSEHYLPKEFFVENLEI
ncbi:hypothetical protein [Formosa sp. L2A11]|uniref:hypothetical protein n=1 Tax=Formosa sp. L2A11 TaxID=2686363 RepID=UPI00131C2ABB|nr:hypothetical protein [Formosa sp. L2A11]